MAGHVPLPRSQVHRATHSRRFSSIAFAVGGNGTIDFNNKRVAMPNPVKIRSAKGAAGSFLRGYDQTCGLLAAMRICARGLISGPLIDMRGWRAERRKFVMARVCRRSIPRLD